MTFSPNLGRWLQEDPIGFEAGDVNLYRAVGNNPVNGLDPNGLDELKNTPWGVKQPQLWFWDCPDSKTESARFAPAWGFTDNERFFYRMGCIGLCAIRTGSYTGLKFPQNGPNVRCFRDLKDALDYQKKMHQELVKEHQGTGVYPPTPVLFSVESENDIHSFCEYVDKEKKEIKPTSLQCGKLEPYDFATAFQESYDGGRIVYWERMPWGQRQNPRLWVHRTKGWAYENVVFCVAVSDSPFRPHPVTKPKIPVGWP